MCFAFSCVANTQAWNAYCSYAVHRKRVERLMVRDIVGVHTSAKVPTATSAEHNRPRPDLVGRWSAAGEPDVALAGDMASVATATGWL